MEVLEDFISRLKLRDIHKKGASLKPFRQEGGTAPAKASKAVRVKTQEPPPKPGTGDTLPKAPKKAGPRVEQAEESPFVDTDARIPIPKEAASSGAVAEESERKEEPGGDPILHAGDLYRVLSGEVLIYRESVQEILRKVREFQTTLEDLEARILDIEKRINR